MVAGVEDGKAIPQGYSLRRVADFISEDCASGKLQPIQLLKKHYIKPRAHIVQKFRAKCLGGPHASIGGEKARVRVERQEDGRDLAVYSVEINGESVEIERYR